MNREIKFRVFDKEQNCFIKDLSDFWITPDFTGLGYHLPLIGFVATDLSKFRERHIFQQYTGLKDSNGCEIYEGDIIKHGYKNQYGTFVQNNYVYYAETKAMFYLASINKEQFNQGAITSNIINRKNGIFEVVGNVFENAGLLK